MNILYVTQFYPPESIASAFRASEHSKLLAQLGNRVTVLTGWPNYPKGEVFEGYDVSLLGEIQDDVIKVLRNKLIATPNRSFFGRIKNGFSFFVYGIFNSFINKNKLGSDYDVVFATSGTVFAGCLGFVLARRLHVPFVLEYRDLTYVQMVATGSKVSSCKVRLMRWLELFLAKKAKSIVTLTNGFKEELVKQGVPEKKISVIPNGSEVISCNHNLLSAGAQLGYFGTLGISQDVIKTIKIAEVINEILPETTYTIIGEGADKTNVARVVHDRNYANVFLLDGMSQTELDSYYSQVDFTFVSLKNNPGFSDTLPSKIFQSFARGIPVIFCGPEGEASRLINQANGGLLLTADSDEIIRKQLTEFFSDTEWRFNAQTMGQSAQEYIKTHYTRKKLVKDLNFVLNSVVENNQGEIIDD